MVPEAAVPTFVDRRRPISAQLDNREAMEQVVLAAALRAAAAAAAATACVRRREQQAHRMPAEWVWRQGCSMSSLQPGDSQQQ